MITNSGKDTTSDFDEVRQLLTKKLLIIIIVIGLPKLFFNVLFENLQSGIKEIIVFSSLYIIILIIFFFREKIRVALQTMVIVIVFWLLGINSVLTLGTTSSGVLFVIGGIVCSLLLSKRSSQWYILLTPLGISITGIVHEFFERNSLEIKPDMYTSYSEWLYKGINIGIYLVFIYYMVTFVRNYLESAQLNLKDKNLQLVALSDAWAYHP